MRKEAEIAQGCLYHFFPPACSLLFGEDPRAGRAPGCAGRHQRPPDLRLRPGEGAVVPGQVVQGAA